MSNISFDKFHKMVLEEESLQAELRDIADEKQFVNRVVALAAERQCSLTEADVENAIRAGRRAWIERGL